MAYFVVLLLALLALPAHAEMGSLFGLGPVSSALGGTSLHQGKPSAYQVLQAPASLGYLRTVEADFSAQYFDPKLNPFGTVVLNSSGTKGEFNSAGVKQGGGQLLALAFPIGRHRPLVLAGSVYLPFSTLLRVSGNPVNYPYYPLYTDISRNFAFAVGAGYELFNGLGVGLNFRSTTKSTAFYALRADNSVNYSASAVEGRSESRISASVVYDHERASSGGAPYSLGFMYRARSGLETRLSADITAFVPIQGVLNSVPSFTPAEWVLMGSWRPFDGYTFSADFAWVEWSAFVSPYGSGNINTQVIGDARQEAGFRDIPVPRFGVEKESVETGAVLKRLRYRAGYLYHPSPVPAQTGDSNFADSDRHLFSVGLGLGLQNPWRDEGLIDVDLFFQYNWLKNREVRKLTSSNVGAPGYTAGGKILFYGLGASLKF